MIGDDDLFEVCRISDRVAKHEEEKPRPGIGLRSWKTGVRPGGEEAERIRNRWGHYNRGQMLRELKQLPDYEGVFHRGETMAELPAKGAVHDFDQWRSATDDPGVADEYKSSTATGNEIRPHAVVWNIKGKAKDLRDNPNVPAAFKSEREVVIPAGSRVLVKNLRRMPDHTEIDADQLYTDVEAVCRLADRARRYSESPYRSSAVRVTNGDVFEGAHHDEAFERARDAGHVPPEKAFDSGAWKTGFVTHAGEFHSYFDAMRARATDRHAMNGQSAVCDKRVWRPQDEEDQNEKHAIDDGFGGWLAAVRFPDGTTFADASHRKAWKKAEAEGRTWSDDAEEGFVDPTGPFLSRSEFHDRTGILPKSGELRDLGWIDKHWDGSHTIRKDQGDGHLNAEQVYAELAAIARIDVGGT